jgi:hypothetical protein
MQVYKNGNKIVFEVLAERKRFTPYNDMAGEPSRGSYPTLTGVIEPVSYCDDPDMGFAYTIDMDYKGKPDQHGGIIIQWHGSREHFEAKCGELGIGIIEYEQCARCKKAILGCATLSKEIHEKYGGPVCSIKCDGK